MWRASSSRRIIARGLGQAARYYGTQTSAKTVSSLSSSSSSRRLISRLVPVGATLAIGAGAAYYMKENWQLIQPVHADTKSNSQSSYYYNSSSNNHYNNDNNNNNNNNHNNDNNDNNNNTVVEEGITKGMLLGGSLLIAGLGLATIFKICYKRCPSNQVLVVYGLVGRESSKCIHGGGTFVLPVFQKPMQIDVNLRAALSKENIRLTVPSFFTVAVGIDEDTMRNAADRILDMDRDALNKQAQDIIFGQMREVIATMSVEEIKGDRLNFVKGVNDSVECELKKIGLTLINVNITDIQDESGYLTALGKKAAESAIQQALIDVSERKKTGEIGVSQNNSEREVGVKLAAQQSAMKIAELEKDEKIFRANAQNEIEMKTAEQETLSKSVIAKAQSDTAVAQTKAKAEQKAREKQEEINLRISISKAEAMAITTETETNMQIAELQAKLKIKQAETYRLEKEAEATMKEAEAIANVRVAIAHGKLVEAEKRAEHEASAKAIKAEAILQAEARAEQTLIEARAEAEAMLIRLEAEARGKGEALKVKGDGLKRIIEATGNPEAAYKLLMLDHIDHVVDATARATANIKFDKIVVWDQGNNTTGNFVKGITNIIPPALNMVKDIGGIDLHNIFSNLMGPNITKESITESEEKEKEKEKETETEKEKEAQKTEARYL